MKIFSYLAKSEYAALSVIKRLRMETTHEALCEKKETTAITRTKQIAQLRHFESRVCGRSVV